jgi:hypothetical protein
VKKKIEAMMKQHARAVNGGASEDRARNRRTALLRLAAATSERSFGVRRGLDA